MNPRTKKFDLVRTIIVLILFGALIEILFRLWVFPDWRSVGQVPFSSHPIYGTFQKPNLSIRRYNPPNYDVFNYTNSMGFRDREIGFQKDLEGIWIIGSSNSYGGFVKNGQLFASKLQGLGYPVANLSSEGHRLSNQLVVVKHLLALGHRPQVIIAEMTLNNAFRNHEEALKLIAAPLDNLEGDEATGNFGLPREMLLDQFIALKGRLDLSWISIKGRFLKNSAIYCWVKIGMSSIPALHRLTLELGLRSDVALADSTPLDLQRKSDITAHDKLIGSTADYIENLRRWVVTETGATFGVLVIPSHHHLNPEYFNRYIKSKKAKLEDYDPARSYRIFVGELEKRGIPVLGLAPALSRSGQFLSFPDDGHLNAKGHRIIAQELAAWLRGEFGFRP